MENKVILERIKALLVGKELQFEAEQNFLDIEVGDVVIRVEGETLEVGQAVQVGTEEGFIPAGNSLDGEHTINDTIVTIQEGVITDIVPAEVAVIEDSVDAPAEELEFQSYADYPESVKEAAQRVIDYTTENGWGDCGTDVGKQRANQLAKGEPISEETIKRMYSYLSRHKVDLETSHSYDMGCGKLMYDAWGGETALEWSKAKLEELGQEETLQVEELFSRVAELEKYYIDFARQIKENQQTIEEFNKVVKDEPAAELETFKTETDSKINTSSDPLQAIRNIRSRKN